MTTTLSRVDAAIEYAVSELSKSDAVIEQIREECLEIVVDGPEDQLNYKRASEAVKRVARLRIDVEKTRRGLKEDALRYGKAVDSEAKRIASLIEPIETHLKAQKAIVDDAVKAAEEAKHAKRREMLTARISAAESVQWIVTAEQLDNMLEDEFEFELIKRRRIFEERQKELAELEEFRQLKAKAEAEKLEESRMPLRERLRAIAEDVENINVMMSDPLLSEQVGEILVSAAEQIRRLV